MIGTAFPLGAGDDACTRVLSILSCRPMCDNWAARVCHPRTRTVSWQASKSAASRKGNGNHGRRPNAWRARDRGEGRTCIGFPSRAWGRLALDPNRRDLLHDRAAAWLARLCAGPMHHGLQGPLEIVFGQTRCAILKVAATRATSPGRVRRRGTQKIRYRTSEQSA